MSLLVHQTENIYNLVNTHFLKQIIAWVIQNSELIKLFVIGFVMQYTFLADNISLYAKTKHIEKRGSTQGLKYAIIIDPEKTKI